MTRTEKWIVVVARRGARKVGQRHPLNVPLDAATGNFERLSDRALNDLITDLQNEKLRRFR